METETLETAERRSVVASYLLAGAALVFVFHFHLVPALVAGLLTHALLVRSARLAPRATPLPRGGAMAGGRGSSSAWRPASRRLALLLHAFVRGHVGNLPDLFRKMADVVDPARGEMERRGPVEHSRRARHRDRSEATVTPG